MTTGAPVRDAASTARGDRSERSERQKPIGYERRSTGRGPKGRLLSGTMAEYGADPIASVRRWRDEYGDFVPIRFGPFRAHMAYGPSEIEEVLVDRAADFRKSFGTRMLIPLLGRGLLADTHPPSSVGVVALPSSSRTRDAGSECVPATERGRRRRGRAGCHHEMAEADRLDQTKEIMLDAEPGCPLALSLETVSVAPRTRVFS